MARLLLRGILLLHRPFFATFSAIIFTDPKDVGISPFRPPLPNPDESALRKLTRPPKKNPASEEASYSNVESVVEML
jgi:hypothetical protein